MIRLSEHKELAEHKAIRDALVPKKVILPLSQHFGKPCDQVLVKAGDLVKTGQMIATAQGGLFAPVHASVSGKVLAIGEYPHPVLGRSKAVVIESDGKDERAYAGEISQEQIVSLSEDQIRKIIFDAGIVGLGGAGFPTHVKLNPPRRIDTFILNGAECEPFLTTDFRLMCEYAKEIVTGAAIIARVIVPKEIIIAIEDNKKEAIEVMRRHMPPHWKIKVLKTIYPQGGEKQVIKSCLKKEVPSGKLPFDIGVVVSNVGTAFAIYEAVYKKKPLYERVVTVTGYCLENPANLMVRVGTPIREVIEQCGPLKEKFAKVVMGGPMMGIAQYTLDAPVIKTTSGIVVFAEKEVFKREDRVCCRCGRCIDVCPARIMPAMIGMAAEKERWDIAKEYDVFDCIECGLCSYICPAKRDLVHLIKFAKAKAKR